MNTRLGIAAAVAALALVGLHFLFAGAVPDAGAPVPDAGSAVAAKYPLSPDTVDEFQIYFGDSTIALLSLVKKGERWSVRNYGGAPADKDKVRRLLDLLLRAPREPAPEGMIPAEGEGVRVVLMGGGQEHAVSVGLHPEGVHDATWVRYDEGVMLLPGDVRGELGLWKNRYDAEPDPAALIESRVMQFEPRSALKLVATYPDHILSFTREDGGDWRNELRTPGGDWNPRALERWLEDIAALRATFPLRGDEAEGHSEEPTHTLSVTLADGEEKSLLVAPNHSGDGWIAWSSDYPQSIFLLPEWRFSRYFNRLRHLFPDAVPHYGVDEIQSLDVRRGGENVKIVRRGDDWRTVALPYPLRRERVERLARLLADWRPEDYADPDGKNVRPPYGGPMIDVVLTSGNAHQYRLSGRHPLLPWRYVTLDGGQTFSVSDAGAAAMFPAFADLLDLGRVFQPPGETLPTLIRLADGEGAVLATVTLEEDGVWTAATEAGSIRLEDGEGQALAEEPGLWPVAGLLHTEPDPAERMYRLEVFWGEVGTAITLFQSAERDIPYVTERGRAFFVDRADFSNWLATVKSVMARVESQSPIPEGNDKEEPEDTVPESAPLREETDRSDEPSESAGEEPPTAGAHSDPLEEDSKESHPGTLDDSPVSPEEATEEEPLQTETQPAPQIILSEVDGLATSFDEPVNEEEHSVLPAPEARKIDPGTVRYFGRVAGLAEARP